MNFNVVVTESPPAVFVIGWGLNEVVFEGSVVAGCAAEVAVDGGGGGGGGGAEEETDGEVEVDDVVWTM